MIDSARHMPIAIPTGLSLSQDACRSSLFLPRLVTPTVDQKCFARHTSVAVSVQAAVLVPDPCPKLSRSGNRLRVLPESGRPVTWIEPTAAFDIVTQYLLARTRHCLRLAFGSIPLGCATRPGYPGRCSLRALAGRLHSVDAVDSLQHGMAFLR